MVTFKCDYNYNNLRNKIIGGKITSIWNNDSFYKGTKSYPVVDFKYYTSEFCDFEKNISLGKSKMNYHLSGYGVLHNEAYTRFLGESVERYTFASLYKLLQNRIIIDTYSNLMSRLGADCVCNLELINAYFRPLDTEHYLSGDCEVQWIKMNSLIEPDKNIYVPLQMIVSNDGFMCANEVQFMPAAVSTGTACHETFIKSIENAVIEFLQIDSFNLWWYGGAKGRDVQIDVHSLLKEFFRNDNSINEFLRNFDVVFSDISFDKDVDVIVCETFGKKDNVPQYTVGVQGGKNYRKTIYRSFMECLAVLEYNMHLPWIDNEKYVKTQINKKPISNLDDNVVVYAKYGKDRRVRHENTYFDKFVEPKSYRPVHSLKKLSKYACFLNVTLPELEGLNMYVSRIVIPELMPMCLPSYPPYNHLRYKQFGGIANDIPHPLA